MADTIGWNTLNLGREVTTGAWIVPAYVGDCPDEAWPLDHDIDLT